MRIDTCLKCFAAVVIAVCSRTLAFAADPPPLSTYAEDPAISEVTLSPDGRYAAFLTSDKGHKTVWLLPADAQQPTAIGADTTEINGLSWAGPDHLLLASVEMANAQPVMPRQRVTQLLSYSLKTHRVVPLLAQTFGVLPYAVGRSLVTVAEPDGSVDLVMPGFNVRSGEFDLLRVNLDTGVGRTIDAGTFNTRAWATNADGELLARSDYNPVQRQWTLLARRNGRWTGVVQEQTEEPPDLVGAGRDDDHVILWRRGDLFEVSLRDGAAGPPIQPQGSYAYRWFEHDKLKLTAVELGGDIPTYWFLDATAAERWRNVKSAFPGQSVQLVSLSNDDSEFIVYVYDAHSGGAYYWVHLNAGRAELLGPTFPDIPSADIAPDRHITYTAQDGLQISAVLTLPARTSGNAPPLVILAGAGLEGFVRTGFDRTVQALASRGYAVLEVNFRGSLGISPSFEQAGYGQLGRAIQTDISDGVKYLADHGLIDPTRVCIVGGGYGGYSALYGVIFQHGIYKCAIAIEPASNLARYIRNPDPDSRGADWTNVEGLRRYLGASSPNDPMAARYSPLEHASEASAPILLMSASPRYTNSDTTLMLGALERAHKQVTFVQLGANEHQPKSAVILEQVLKNVIDFLNTNLPAR